MEKEVVVPFCAICGTTQQLLRCAKCKTAYYCSATHQHADWPAHKQKCRLLAKQKNNNKIQLLQLQQAVAAATINNSNGFSMCGGVDSNAAGTANGSGSDACISSATVAATFFSNPAPANVTAAADAGILAAVQPMSVINQQQLGTNENEILHSQAETVSQNSNSGYCGNADANSTTMDQMQFRATTGNVDNSDSGEASSYLIKQQQSEQSQQPWQLLLHQQTQSSQQKLQQPQQQQILQQQQQQKILLQQQQLENFPQQHQQQQQQFQYLINHNSSQHEKTSSYQIGHGDENASGNTNERRYEELCRNIINDMNQYGLSVVDDFLGMDKGLQILNEVHRMYAAGVFKDGQLVNNSRAEQDLRTIRGDKITWVKGVEPGCSNVGYLINQIDAVICRANTMKNNGKLGNYNIKERTKAMVACYPGSGSHYVMHVDNPNRDGRVITAIYYLNVNWDTKRSGGVLRIFPEHGNSIADIEPKFDRLIFFWSDKRNPHEVQPAHRTRYAITVWYFDANEREAALNRCKPKQTSSIRREMPTANNHNAANTTPNPATMNTKSNTTASEICT